MEQGSAYERVVTNMACGNPLAARLSGKRLAADRAGGVPSRMDSLASSLGLGAKRVQSSRDGRVLRRRFAVRRFDDGVFPGAGRVCESRIDVARSLRAIR